MLRHNNNTPSDQFSNRHKLYSKILKVTKFKLLPCSRIGIYLIHEIHKKLNYFISAILIFINTCSYLFPSK